LYDNQDKLVSVALILKIVAKRGTFLFCPHGPHCTSQNQSIDGLKKILCEWTKYLIGLAKTEKCSFIRIQPILLNTLENQNLFKTLKYNPAPIHMHTELSTVVDLTLSFDEIKAKMRKTTRQMIKKGEALIDSGDVEIEYFDSVTNEIYEIYKQTQTRGKFVGFSKTFLQQEFESFKSKDKVVLFGIRFKGELLSWGMVLIVSNRSFYHQGGNILNKNVPASYLIHWIGMKIAKENGCISYDLWGVSPLNKPNHPWAHISTFKRGFGGSDVELLHAQDYVINFMYYLNYIIEKIRSKTRGFS
jgi:lipid II:glycine glycyltransferase (peptidoglycan interpeptide bridge formation enzyme)